VLQTLLSYSDIDIRVERDPDKYRPVDVPLVYGSAEKFQDRTGWRPEIQFETTLQDTLAYWREQVQDR
jgi:GDP-4-dehydro-6-deoxy-D-mannose reductase